MLAKLHQRLRQGDDAEYRRNPGDVPGEQDVPYVKHPHDSRVPVHLDLHTADRESQGEEVTLDPDLLTTDIMVEWQCVVTGVILKNG